MARLERGMDAKIDHINDLVASVKSDNNMDAMGELLAMFKPMLIKTCDKWSKYFDPSHKLVSFDEILSDAEFWFMKYTIEKYTIDGDATYNKFIKDHIDQRIRYIYERQLKYYRGLIFPDPDRNSEVEGIDAFEKVIYNYSSTVSDAETLEDTIIEDNETKMRNALAHRIMDIVSNSNTFNDREKKIFNDVICNGVTQDEMSKRLGISRTRVVQIIKKVKPKLRNEMEKDNQLWEIITQTDIMFDV